MSKYDIVDRVGDLKTIHVLSLLVCISLAFSGFTALKLVQLENRISEGEVSNGRPAFTLPTGVPSPYGDELKISFGDVSRETPEKAQRTIKKLASLERINLTEAEKERYVNILYEMNGGISCEYCCKARSVITKEGESGCGCSHAAAMRGLTKYLLREHGEEMTDQEIFREISKWKTRFFPTQTRSKAEALNQRGVETSYVNLASNKYRGVSTREGGWVGKC